MFFKKVPKAQNPLNAVDLCFVIDSTGSMQPFIEAARRQLIDTMEELSARSSVDLYVGLVEFRDHPPQESSFVTRVNQLTDDLKKMQKIINRLKANGGGDAPEAVYDGVFDACTRIQWRPFSSRFLLLIGDAPPHGAGGRLDSRHRIGADAEPNKCQCGLTADSVTAAAENNRVTIHALAMPHSRVTVESFAGLARGTGGHFALATAAHDVVEKIIQVIDTEFRNIEFDERVLKAVRELKSIDVNATADGQSCSRLEAASSIARLGRRGFLEEFTNKASAT
jgi:hypothetical protein